MTKMHESRLKWILPLLISPFFYFAQAESLPEEKDRFRLKNEDVVHILNYQAEISPKNSVKIVPQVSGLVTKRYFEAGDFVKEGQVLYELDAEPYVLDLEESTSELERRKTILQKLQADLDRAEQLSQSLSISEAELRSLQMDVKAAKSAVQNATALSKASQYKLNKTKVVSPINGYVEIPHIDVGTYVKAEMDVLTVVADQSAWYIDFEVPYSEYMKYRLSNLVPISEEDQTGNQYFRLSMPKLSIDENELSLIYRARQMSRSSGGIHFRALLNRNVDLVAGTREGVAIEILRSDEFHKVPRQTLLIEEGNYFVMGVQADGTLEKSRVEYMTSFDGTFVLVHGYLPYKAISMVSSGDI